MKFPITIRLFLQDDRSKPNDIEVDRLDRNDFAPLPVMFVGTKRDNVTATATAGAHDHLAVIPEELDILPLTTVRHNTAGVDLGKGTVGNEVRCEEGFSILQHGFLAFVFANGEFGVHGDRCWEECGFHGVEYGESL